MTTEATYRLIPIPGVELTPACPYCEGPHALARCTAFAAEAGAPLIGRLRAENAALRADLDDAHQHVGALIRWMPLPQYAINEEQRAAVMDAIAWLRRGAR